MREAAGLSEISGFAKYEITGPGAAAWLDRLLACRLPEPGRMTLAPMLNERGKLIGDFTLANLSEDEDDPRFYLVGSGVAEEYHMRWFEAQAPEDGVGGDRALGARHGRIGGRGAEIGGYSGGVGGGGADAGGGRGEFPLHGCA